MHDRGELPLPVEVQYEMKKAKDLTIFAQTEADKLGLGGGIGSIMSLQAT